MTEPTVIFFDLGDTLIDSQEQRYSDALDTLQILQERGYRLGLLSNQPSGTTASQVYSRLENLALAPYIEYHLVTISTEIPGNVGKPNRPIFDLALQKAGHTTASNQSIFVTETMSHIQAARSYGWRAILKRNTATCQPTDGECVTSLAGLLGLLPEIAGITGTNLDLAPPPKLVDNLWAVPVDIQRISAALTFDGATYSATGDATVEFKMGHYTGNPIFDLRQTITAAWLDGTSLPVTKLALHDFGGGPQAELRVIEEVLAAGSNHTLRVTYSLGTPQASTAGSYQPAITWTNGPRLAFNFGFTDLGAGRYLEAWMPANLIFDQFELQLELHILNTTVSHSVITNGQVTPLGVNHWRVSFPARFTALSQLLELRPSDTLSGETDIITLPVSGSNVTIEAWNLPDDPQSPSRNANLQGEISNIKNYLTDNENSTGPYMHGNRFVALLHKGGMEYDGGTTTHTGALRHETFHSWWARGVKPATQPDAWFDEGWATYFDYGATSSEPFDFVAPPVTLRSRKSHHHWIRVTAGNAYSDGYRFWKGVAALIGVSALKALMSDFYKQRRHRPATTTDIEEFLLCRTGNVQLVDAFHRFVYGFDNQTPAPDLWLRDAPVHTGSDPWAGRFWDSPDLWVRTSNDGGTIHQNPEYGQDNWFYARVRNRGTGDARHFVITFNVKSFAGTRFVYPNDFLPCIAAVSGFDLGPGASVIVKARWPRALVPAPGSVCLFAAVLTRGDHPISGHHVWEHNNLAQKNLTIVDLARNRWIVVPFVVLNLRSLVTRTIVLELIRPKEHARLEASLLHHSSTIFKQIPGIKLTAFEFQVPHDVRGTVSDLDCGGSTSFVDRSYQRHPPRVFPTDETGMVETGFVKGMAASFPSGVTAQIPIVIRQQEQLRVGLQLKVPSEAKLGQIINIDLIQRDAKTKRVEGGIAVQIRVI